MPSRKVLWAAGAAAVATVACWALLSRAPTDPGHPREPARDGAEPRGGPPETGRVADKPSEVSVGPRDDGCEIVGTVRRDGSPVAARIEVRLWETNEEDLGHRLRWNLSAFAPRPGLLRLSDAPVATTTSGPDGRFLVKVLAPASYGIRATTPDGAIGGAHAILDCRGERQEADVEILPGHERLRGHVLRADGGPWRGIVVVLPLERRFWMPALHDGVAATLDAEGRFDLGGLPKGRVVVCAVADDGSMATGRPLELPHDGETTLSAATGSVEVKGRIVAAVGGEPIPGAEVVGSGAWPVEFGARNRTTTDAEGRFVVRVPAPKGLLSARAPGFVEASLPVDGTEPSAPIRLAREARVRGRVTSGADGKPAAGVAVLVISRQRGMGPATDVVGRATTDAEGRYEVRGLGAYEIVVVGRGAGRVSSNFVPGDAAEAPRSLMLEAGTDAEANLVMVAAARVVGTVRDSAGAPVRGARVVAVPSVTGLKSRHLVALPWSAYSEGVDASATLDDGSFAIDSLVPGVAVELTARAVGAPCAADQRVTPLAGRDTRIDIRLPVPRWVDVKVVEKGTGAPIPSAHVSVFAFDDPPRSEEDDEDGFQTAHFAASSEQASSRTDASGRARVGPVGVGRLSAWVVEAAGFAGASHGPGVAVVEGPGGALTVTVELERGRSIGGEVRFEDGTPAVGVEVSLQTATGPGSWNGRGTTTDASGAFEFEDVGEGDHALRATLRRDGEYVAERPAVAGATNLVLTLSKGPGPDRLLVRVVDPDGNPVPAATGHFRTDSGGFGGHMQNGRLEFDFSHGGGGRPDVGTVVVEMAKDSGGALLPLGRAHIENVRPGQEVELRLPPERVIEGRVVGPDGKGIPDVRVRADVFESEDASGEIQRSPWMWTLADAVRTDANGAFRVGHLGEGAHWIVALPPAAFCVPDPVAAKAGDRSVLLRARSATPVAVTIDDAEGQHVAGARVVVARRSGAPTDLTVMNLFGDYGSGVETIAGPDGVARLDGLDPALRYVLGIRGPTSRPDVAERVEDGWRPADATIRLERGHSVEGVVRNLAGDAVAGAFVYCQRENGVSTSRSTGPDGTFRFVGLEAGRVALEARVFSPQGKPDAPEPRGTGEATAGSKDVVLVVK